MLGARVQIHDGDLVYIRQQDDVDNGTIAAVLINEEATLKRVYKQPNKLILQPENPDFEPMVYIGQELESIRSLAKRLPLYHALNKTVWERAASFKHNRRVILCMQKQTMMQPIPSSWQYAFFM